MRESKKLLPSLQKANTRRTGNQKSKNKAFTNLANTLRPYLFEKKKSVKALSENSPTNRHDSDEGVHELQNLLKIVKAAKDRKISIYIVCRYLNV
jgi:t-SNARE complex subunit (syntaxin)